MWKFNDRIRLLRVESLALLIAALVFELLVIASVKASTLTGQMTSPRCGHTATLLPNGKVLVAGGTDGVQAALGTAELYDQNTGTWTAARSLNNPRQAHTATLLSNGKVLVAGGYDGTNAIASAELYDPGMGTWALTASSAVRYGHTATLLLNGKVLSAGGNDGSTELDSAEVYDPVAGTWTNAGPMIYSHWGHTATLLASGKVLVTGGDGTAGGTGTETYDPATGMWSAGQDMLYSRTIHTATLLPNGKVLVAGGGWYSLFGFTITPTAELYDSSNGTFVETGMMVSTNFSSLLTGRANHTAILLTNGLVFVSGGEGRSALIGNATISTCELYHPETGTWTASGTMTITREIHTATLLSNGHVLLAGGFDLSTPDSAFSSCELYSPVPAIPPILTNVQKLPNGSVRFTFTNNPGAGFSALLSTNPALPFSNWTTIGGITEISSGHFQFTDIYSTNYSQRFYRVRSL